MKKRLCCHCKSYFDINHPKECLHQECDECSKLEKLNEYYLRISIGEEEIKCKENKKQQHKKKENKKKCFSCFIL